MNGPTGSLRAFIALSVPPAVKRSLEPAVTHLSVAAPGSVRWAGLDGIHLTLKFLGNIEAAQVEGITQGMRRACRGVSPFRLALSGLGAFPNAFRPRVIWAGVQGDLESVMKLQAGIETDMTGLGFPPDKGPFTPHLTLGRVRDRASNAQRSRLGNAVAACSPVAGCSPVAAFPIEAARPWLVEAVQLVRSDLGPGGATYSGLASVTLGPGIT